MSGVRTTREGILSFVRDELGIGPDYPWEGEDNAVLRHPDNRKWFALIMNVPADRLGLEGHDSVDIMNVKCDPAMLGSMLGERGFFPAYHMSKTSWITVLLDGSVEAEKVLSVLEISYDLTAKKLRKRKS